MSFPIPRGSMALPMTQVRAMVSLSAEFRDQTNTGTANDALKRISFTRVGEDKKPRPFACVLLGDSHNYQQFAGGVQNFLIPGGTIGLYMTRNTDPLDQVDLDAATIDAANFFGSVMDDVVAISGQDEHLPISSVDLAIFNDSGDEETKSIGDFFYAVYLLTWGGN